MLEQDYLMRMLIQFFKALVRSRELVEDRRDPLGACDALEDAISNATEMDGAALLSLSPDSIAQIMRVTGVDPNVTQFVARSMLLESVYLQQAGDAKISQLRFEQAHAIATEYGFGLPPDPADFEAITEGLEDAALAGGFDGLADVDGSGKAQALAYDGSPSSAALDDKLALLWEYSPDGQGSEYD